MKIIFECFGFTKETYYVEQTPKELIEQDFNKWKESVVKSNSGWRYGV